MFETHLDDRTEGTWLVCRGNLDGSTGEQLRAEARSLMRRGVAFTIDLGGLGAVDVLGLLAVVQVRREAVGRAARVGVHVPPGSVAERAVAAVERALESAERERRRSCEGRAMRAPSPVRRRR